MAGLVAAIHVFLVSRLLKKWMSGTMGSVLGLTKPEPTSTTTPRS